MLQRNEQTEGAPIDSPLPPVLANPYTEDLEVHPVQHQTVMKIPVTRSRKLAHTDSQKQEIDILISAILQNRFSDNNMKRTFTLRIHKTQKQKEEKPKTKT